MAYNDFCSFLELSLLLSKLHESFISLAAQLQNVHEAVKVSLLLNISWVIFSLDCFNP